MSEVWFTGAGIGIGAGPVKAALQAGDRVVGPALEARLQELCAHAALSRSTDGKFGRAG